LLIVKPESVVPSAEGARLKVVGRLLVMRVWFAAGSRAAKSGL
jgi:hypothetical protein